MYKIPERLKNMEVYEPVTGTFRIRLDANESFLDLPDSIREEVGKAVSELDFQRYQNTPWHRSCAKNSAVFFRLNQNFSQRGMVRMS